MTSTDLPLWEQRFRAPRVSLPDWAQDAPERCLYTSNVTGTWELYAWDRSTGAVRRVTERDAGTSDGALPPDGSEVWWFDDSEGDEFGTWKKQPWEGGPDVDATPGVPAAYPAGLEVGRTVTLVGCATDDGVEVHAVQGGEARVLYTHEEDADVAGLSRDETLWVLEHSEHGDSHHKALRVLTLDGDVVADLWDGEGKGLSVLGFSPVPGDGRLLAVHERTGRPRPFLWDPRSGAETELPVDDLPGDLAADWYEDGSALLVLSEHAARATLHRLDLVDGTLTSLPTPPGTVTGATTRPDGSVEYSWSSAAEPTVVRSTTGDVVLAPPGPPAPGSVPVEDLWVEGPGGTVHALLARPEGDAPFPVVFVVHGGPTHHDTDSFAGDRAAYVDLGCAVVEVNYRGSTGYGAAWRDAIIGRPGLTELEDLAAVRQSLVDTGVADPARIALTGGSWGGYLTLLGLGVQPDLWTLGVAAVPVADYLAAYEDEMEPLRAFDRALFGGSPTEVPERYTASSPLTHVDAVRAPVLVLAGANDPRCPLRQIENWLAAAAERGKEVEEYRFDAGHGSLVVDERVRQMRAELTFVARRFGLPDPA
ncbi:MAG: peptidase prolyl oligopeptidase active site domain protein [Frankiales bacterium]|nr:peptidase prolyl oligopeptidase active site domain protein [Frankiales bacterium]